MSVETISQTYWLDTIPLLENLDKSLKERLFRSTRVVSYKKEQVIFRPGEDCRYFILVVDGCVRIHKYSENGHELNLHRMKKGDFCEVSAVCFLADNHYCAEAIAEKNSRVALIDKSSFYEILQGSPQFRQEVFRVINSNLAQLISFVETIAFSPLELRLAARLVEAAADSIEINETHREIAADLGTSREVVSRMLKKFERKNWVSLRRGVIRVVDPAALDACVKKSR